MKAITTTPATPTGLSPEQLTVAIRQEHEAASAAARSALGHALEAGRLLAEAKVAIPHGSWEAYLRDGCSMAPRTARLYLRLHRHRDRLPNRQHVAELSVRQAARLLEQPRAKAETVLPVAVAEAHTLDRHPKAIEAISKAAELVAAAALLADSASELGITRWDEQTSIADKIQSLSDASKAWTRHAALFDVPSWYQPGHHIVGYHKKPRWRFEILPHPRGEPWVHMTVWDMRDTASPNFYGSADHGTRRDGILAVLDSFQTIHEMPPVSSAEWKIDAGESPVLAKDLRCLWRDWYPANGSAWRWLRREAEGATA